MEEEHVMKIGPSSSSKADRVFLFLSPTLEIYLLSIYPFTQYVYILSNDYMNPALLQMPGTHLWPQDLILWCDISNQCLSFLVSILHSDIRLAIIFWQFFLDTFTWEFDFITMPTFK